MNTKIICMGLISIMISSSLAQTTSLDLYDQQAERMLEHMRKQMEMMEEQMERSFNRNPNAKNRLSNIDSIFIQQDQMQHEYIDQDKEILLKIKVKTEKDSPIDIKIKDGMVTIKGEIINERVTKGKNGTSTSKSISSMQKSVPVPDNVETAKVRIEQKDGEVLIHFPKKII